MAVTTKLEVEYSQFKSGMAEAQASVKTLDAELKKSEAEFRATGDAEKYMSDQVGLLNQKLNSQKEAAKNAEQMLLNLGKRGVSPTSVEYQRMAQKMLTAQTAIANTQAELNKLNGEQTQAASSAKTLSEEVSGIGKNVSLQNISDGLSKVTDGMEKAYRTAVRFGRAVLRSAMEATGWADDVMTRAKKYGTDAETIQRMDQVAAYIDVETDTIMSARDKMSKNRESLAELLGISSDGRNVDDVFWEAGEAIMNLGEGFDQNEIAMKIFGRSWRDLIPLFSAGREEYEALMESQNVLTNEQVQSLNDADDAFKSVQNEIENLKRTFWSEHAGTIVEMLEWVVKNKGGVIAALTAIGGAFAALKLAEAALNITKIVNGLKDLNLFGGGGAAGAAGAAGAKAAADTATVVASGGGIATGIANFLTSSGGQAVIGSTMLMPIITKAMTGELFQNPDDYLPDIVKETKGIVGYQSGNVRDMWNKLFGGDKAEIPVEAKVEDGEAEKIASEIGTVTVPATLDWRPSYMQGYPQQVPGLGGHANGLPYVPYDGLALLHKGEEVRPAREVTSRNFSSNLYVESMIMNNGPDASGLASSLAAAQRRTRSGYGS